MQEKSQRVLEMQNQRANEFKVKNAEALARAKANEDKLLSLKRM